VKKIFRNLGEQIMPPAVDLNRLTTSLARVAELDRQLDITLAQLANDLPGDANAVAAAGIAFRAQINKSASMIELGVAAVDALRRAGWTLTAPATTQPVRTWIAPPGSGPEVVAAAERENAAERAASDIPDDWSQ
jgi:hypothetical protein